MLVAAGCGGSEQRAATRTCAPTPGAVEAADLASSGTADAVANVCATDHQGTGYTIYSNAFLLVMVPHSIATVSLATAMLPRLSSYAA